PSAARAPPMRSRRCPRGGAGTVALAPDDALHRPQSLASRGSPHRLVVALVIVVRIVDVLGPAVELDVVLRHQVHWSDVPARRLAGERSVQLVDELPSGLVERFRDRTDLIAPGAHTVEGRDAAVAGRDEPGRTGGRDAGGTKRRRREVEVEIVDSEPDRPAGAEPLQQ